MQLGTRSVSQFEGACGTAIAVRPRLVVTGTRVADLNAELAQKDVAFRVEQPHPAHSRKSYVVAFCIQRHDLDRRSAEVTDAVLAIWTWI